MSVYARFALALVILFATPPLCHVLKADKYAAIVRIACRTDMKKQNATSNSREFMGNFEALNRTPLE